MKKPASALGSDGRLYINIDEVLSDDDRRRLDRAVKSVVPGAPVFIGVIIARGDVPALLRRVDDALAEGWAASSGRQRRRRTARSS